MAHPMTLPVAAGLAILGASFGAFLGRSAIAEINPAYFGEPETRFHADLSPNPPDWAQVQVAEYQQAGGYDGLGSGCIGCRDYPVEYAPRHDPAVDGYQDGWSASAPDDPGEPAVVYSAVAETPDPERAQIERYASYPIVEEASAPVVQDEADAPAEDTESYATAQ